MEDQVTVYCEGCGCSLGIVDHTPSSPLICADCEAYAQAIAENEQELEERYLQAQWDEAMGRLSEDGEYE